MSAVEKGTAAHKAVIVTGARLVYDHLTKPDVVMSEPMYEAIVETKKAEIISEFPDRLCIEQDSKFFSTSTPWVGVKVDGVESDLIVEYCLSGRWVRQGERGLDGKMIRDGRKFKTTHKWDCDIELYWRQTPSRQVRRALKRVGR